MRVGEKRLTCWELSRLSCLMFLGIWAFVSVGPAVNGQERCRLSIRQDIYFLPPSELADTKSYPEVLILENDSVTVWLVPNRGRLIFDLLFRETGHSQLLAISNPRPLRFLGTYTFEFGGIYATFPWNKRDQQPLNLSFEVLQSGETCEVLMRSQDPETGVQFTGRVCLPSAGTEVRIFIVLTNPTGTARTIPFGIVALVRPGGAMTHDTELIIPTESVRVGPSQDGWMGPEGAQVHWPTSWTRWGDFQGAGWFYVNLEDVHTPELAVYNPQADESLLLRWEPQAPWRQLAIFSWGPAYTRELGAYPAFRIELQADVLLLPPGGEKIFDLRLNCQKGRPS